MHFEPNLPKKLTGPESVDRFAGWLGRSFDYARWTVTVMRIEHESVTPKVALVLASCEIPIRRDHAPRELSGGIAVLFVAETGAWLSTSMTVKYGPRNDETALWTLHSGTTNIDETGAEFMPQDALAAMRDRFRRLAECCLYNLSR